MFLLGSANIIDMSRLPIRDQRQTYGSHDPIIVKKDLGLAKLLDELFGAINTGVRLWPYLLVAKEVINNNFLDKPSELRKLFKKIKSKEKSNRYGPKSEKTFRNYLSPYIGMYNKIHADPKYDALKNFLGTKKYSGNPGTFYKYTDGWKSALVKATGKPGKKFAGLLRKYTFYNSITQILQERDDRDELLYRGAFCYAFLRCLYGEYRKGKVEKHQMAKTWSKLLLTIISEGRIDTAGNLHKYIPHLEKASSVPPFASITKKIKKLEKEDERRFILSDLKFSTFYNLYLRPIPKVLEK